jgi:parallel beta-helix repeat protein
MSGVCVTVGEKSGDFRGNTSKIIQGAVDYVSSFGGGTVKILEGSYLMYDAVHLRSHITLSGSGPDKTVLRMQSPVLSPLTQTSGYGEKEVYLAKPDGFEPGRGVQVMDDAAQGFHSTVATILAKRNGGIITICTPLNMNCFVKRNAFAGTVHSAVEATECADIRVDGIGIRGMEDMEVVLDGCRGGGIYLYRTRNSVIENCLVEDFPGDGISFQSSDDIIINNVCCRNNMEKGIHPGSGSKRPVIRNSLITGNGNAGVYFCWNVKHGRLDACTVKGNRDCGISIGHRDTDNRLTQNEVYANTGPGIEFRNEDAIHAAHRTTVEGNTIYGNGSDEKPYQIYVRGGTDDVLILKNLISRSHSDGKNPGQTGSVRQQVYGIFLGADTGEVHVEGNKFTDIPEADQVIFEGKNEVTK